MFTGLLYVFKKKIVIISQFGKSIHEEINNKY